MNKFISKFLLTWDKFIRELHLKQPGFTYSACGPFGKHREGTQKFRQTVNLRHLYWNESSKDFFAHDAAYSESKHLANRTLVDKILEDRAW